MARQARVAIIGGGIAGITTAYQLHKKGFDVDVYEQNDNVAQECSFANGGQISVCNSEVWTSWSTIWKGTKWLLKKDAPLLIRMSPSIDKMLWLGEFVYHTLQNSYTTNTIKTIKLGLDSRIEYQKIIEDTKIQFDFLQKGILHIYKNVNSFEKAKRAEKLFTENGVEWIPVSPSDIVKLEPALQTFDNLVGGIWTPSDSTGDINKFCVNLSKWLIDNGVIFFFNYKVESIADNVINNTFYDDIIIANGYQLKEFAKQNNEFVNVYPIKGYSITIDINESDVNNVPYVSLLDDDKKIVSSRLGNRFRVAGTAEIGNASTKVLQERIQPLKQWVDDNFHIDQTNISEWACLRPMTANMIPIVRQSKIPHVWYHGGHGHLGWTLCGATSKHLAELIYKAK